MARKQYPLRIDPQIWEAVQRWANDDFRSVNAQVEWILRDALRRAGRLRPIDASAGEGQNAEAGLSQASGQVEDDPDAGGRPGVSDPMQACDP